MASEVDYGAMVEWAASASGMSVDEYRDHIRAQRFSALRDNPEMEGFVFLSDKVLEEAGK